MVQSKHLSTQGIFALIALMSLSLLCSCGTKDDNASSGNTDAKANYASLWTNVFANRCGACHGVTTNSNTLDGPDLRTQASFYAAMVSKKGGDYPNWDTFQQNRVDCMNYSFVAPGNAAQSLLVAILDPTVAPCTVKSHIDPPESISISATSLASLKTWINAGAAQ